MVRYIKQRDTYSCGPVALINVLKWSGANKTYKDMPRAQRMVKCSYKEGGTDSIDLHRALKKQKSFNVQFVSNVSIYDIDERLEDGGSVIMLESRKPSKKLRAKGIDRVGHYYLIDGLEVFPSGRIWYHAVNYYKTYSKGFVDAWISRRTLVKKMRKCLRSHGDPKAWLIDKK